jgi:hypothetical protein
MYICHRPEKCWKEALDLYKKLLDKQLLLLNLNVNGWTIVSIYLYKMANQKCCLVRQKWRIPFSLSFLLLLSALQLVQHVDGTGNVLHSLERMPVYLQHLAGTDLWGGNSKMPKRIGNGQRTWRYKTLEFQSIQAAHADQASPAGTGVFPPDPQASRHIADLTLPRYGYYKDHGNNTQTT